MGKFVLKYNYIGFFPSKIFDCKVSSYGILVLAVQSQYLRHDGLVVLQ